MNHTTSTTIPTEPAVEEVTASTNQARLQSWVREPLLHFLLLGALLFALDHFINGRANDPHRIVVDAAVDNQAVQVFKAARGRAPNEDELYALRRVWLDN